MTSSALTIVAVTKIRYQEPVSIRYALALTQQLEPILPGSAPGRTRSSDRLLRSY